MATAFGGGFFSFFPRPAFAACFACLPVCPPVVWELAILLCCFGTKSEGLHGSVALRSVALRSVVEVPAQWVSGTAGQRMPPAS